MSSIDIRLGYDGKCAIHRTTPTVFRRTNNDLVVKLESDMGLARFVNLIVVHCAAGHQYYAIDLDQMIPDPFSEEETVSIVIQEETT